MSQSEDAPTGIPTRAIHEAYLDMQRSLKEHRQAVDRGEDGLASRAHGELQDAVLTLYEMLRPHIRQNSAIDAYWDGEPPSYPAEGAPDPEDGTAIIAWQVHPRSMELNGADPGELQSLQDWHDALGLDDGAVRLQAVTHENGQVFLQYQTYEMGLRRLDSWGTEFEQRTESRGGFLGAEQTTTTVRQRVPVAKLQRAARELSNAAGRLGALSQFDASTPRTEITKDLIEDVNEWRKHNIED